MPACDPKSDEARNNPNDHCGTDFAMPYFISFYVLCSFLVSSNNIFSFSYVEYIYELFLKKCWLASF